jgi:hypothetical protein
MGLPENVSLAQELLARAADEPKRLRRHLLVAAALTELLDQEPIVVGGTAEEFHTAAGYHQTDLDLCGWVTKDEQPRLRKLGFSKEGRHWFHRPSKVAVEFPATKIDGDIGRLERRRVGGGRVAIIGVDDLYLDRVRQATVRPEERSMEFLSALAVGAAAFDRLDRRYVARRIRDTEGTDATLGARMRRIDSRIRRRARSALP